jgi:hypothetical protein
MALLSRWMGRLFNAGPPEKIVGLELQGAYWEVAGRRLDQAEFFHALSPLLAGHDAILFLEGSAHPPAIRTFLEANSVPARAKVALGTIWPRGARFHLPATIAVLGELGDLAETCAAPEICNHLHLYDAEGVLLQWYDAFGGPFYVSQVVSRESLDAFCSRLNTSFKEGASVKR